MLQIQKFKVTVLTRNNYGKEYFLNTESEWILLKEEEIKIILYECGFCKYMNFLYEGHWELNCYYYLTCCCSLCGSEKHISSYCPNMPNILTFHQSIIYIRQLA